MLKLDNMLTLGIDPGTASTGFGLINERNDKLCFVECGVIKTSPKNTAQERLRQIYHEAKALFRRYQPGSVAVEKLFFGKNAKTAIKVGQARGIILLAAAEAGIEIAEYTPLEVKMALTGYGRADKKQIQQMVKTLLGLNFIPKPDDAADALAVAICHQHSYRLAKL